MSIINPKQMADVISTLLNGASFSIPFKSQVLLKPLFDLTELGDLKVTVVPVSLGLEKIARGMSSGQYEIDIAVQQKLPAEDNGYGHRVPDGAGPGDRRLHGQ